MDFIEKMVEQFLKLNRKMKRWQRAVSILGAVVVFASTYMLVLPAITLDKDTASTQAGIEVAASENDPSEDGTVYEAEPEEVEAEEETAEDEEEASSTDSGSDEAEAAEEETAAEEEVTEAPAEETAASEDAEISEDAPAVGEDAEPENTEEPEAAPEGVTEDAAAAATEEAAPEIELITEDTQLVYEGSDYKVYADFGAAAKLPAGVELEVEEITEGSDAYDAYYEAALAQMQDKYDEYTKLSFAKFYDITFVKDGAKVEPAGDVKIRIEYDEAVEIKKDVNVDTVHFDDDAEPEVIDSEAEGTEKAIEAVEFKNDQFSVYGVVGSETLTGGIITADGKEYEVTVTYEVDAEIPNESRLELVEYAKGSAEYEAAKAKVDEFKAAQDDEEKPEDLGFDALGITIVDPEGNEVEPKDTVKVSIVAKSLPEGVENAEQLLGAMSVHHLIDKDGDTTVEQVAGAPGDGSIVSASDNKPSIEFTTDSFSTYTITFGNNQSVLVHFVYDDGSEIPNNVPITYKGQTFTSPTSIDTFISNGEYLDFDDFEVDGYTFSNVHIGTYEDLSAYGTAGTNTIIGHRLYRTPNNGTLQYEAYNNVDDDAGSTWVNFGSGNMTNGGETIQRNSPITGNRNSYQTNGVTPLYVVYSNGDVTMPGSGGGSGGGDDEDPDLGEIATSKEVYPAGTDRDPNKKGDGTYMLELSVTGQAKQEEEIPHVNVCFILDCSTSMTRVTDDFPNGRPWLRDTKEMMNEMVSELALNNQLDPDAVEFSLITFNANAQVRQFNGQTWTKDPALFKNTLDPIGVQQGTNWAQALDLARSIHKDDGDPTYVIFLTDGAPSRYWHDGTAFYSDGEGCYYGARDEARNLVRRGEYYFYGIFAYSTDSRDFLAELVDYAYNDSDARDTYYTHANNADDVKAKMEEILAVIQLNFAYADVTVNDGITGMTSTIFEEVNPGSFEYEITYQDYSSGNPTTETVAIVKNPDGTIDIPSVTYTLADGTSITTAEYTITGAGFKATDPDADPKYQGKAVTWEIKQVTDSGNLPYMLEQNWTYTFRCQMWPSQPSYDLIAALNNGLLTWGDDFDYVDANGNAQTIDAEVYMAQVDNTKRPFELKTNTHAEVTYRKYKRTTKEDGTIEYTPIGAPITSPIEYDSGMPLDESKILLEKDWETSLTTVNYDQISSVDMYVLQDNPTAIGFDKSKPETYYKKVTLTKEKDWKAEVIIAPGIFDGNVFRTTGHTYSVVEPDIAQIANLNHYEFVMDPVHPMLDGRTVDIITDMVDSYNASEASQYRKMEYDEEAGLTKYIVYNILKGEIIVNKEIDVEDQYKAFVNEDQKFKFEITLTDENGDPVYTQADVEYGKFENLGYEICDEKGAQVSRGTVPSTGKLDLAIDASQSIHVLNVPSDTYYTVKEYDVQKTVYDYKKVETEVRERAAIGSTTWNTLESFSRDYSGTDDWLDTDGLRTTDTVDDKLVIYPNAENEVTFTNTYIGTGHEAIKIWDDQDDALGLRPEKITLQLKQKATAEDGTVVFDFKDYGDPTDIGIEVGNPPVSNVEVSSNGNQWKYTWKGLPLKGTETPDGAAEGITVTYEYDFDEIIVPNYMSVKDGNTITNTLYRKIKFIKIDMESKTTADGTGETIIPVEGAEFTIEITDPSADSGKKTLTLTSGADGVMADQDGNVEFLIPIMDNAATLTETKYPTGYTMLMQPVVVSVRKTGASYTYQYVSDPVLEEIDDKGMTTYVIRIRDSKGVELPFTGGPGTLIYTLSGIMLIFAAAMMYGFRMRRRERRLN